MTHVRTSSGAYVLTAVLITLSCVCMCTCVCVYVCMSRYLDRQPTDLKQNNPRGKVRGGFGRVMITGWRRPMIVGVTRNTGVFYLTNSI